MDPARGGLRWLILGIVLLTLGSAVPSRAQEPADGAPVTAPVNLSVWPHLSTNQRVGPRVRNFLSLGLGIDRPYQVTGLQAALGAALVEDAALGLQLGLGLAATGAGPVMGIQLGGVGAIATGPVLGLQVAGGIAVSEYWSDVYTGWRGESRSRWRKFRGMGIQLAGVGALSERMYGLQAAGGAAATRELLGAQVAGLFNLVYGAHTGLQLAPFNLGKKVRGVQLGLVNGAGEFAGVQLGLVNLTHGVPTAAEAWATELVPVSVAWRTGRPALHTLVGVGVMALGGPRPTALVGLGTNVRLGERATFSPDLVYSQAFRLSPASTAAQVLQLRLPVRWALGHGLWLQAGPTLNAGRFVDPAPGYLPSVASTQVGCRTVHFWPGASVGIGLRIPPGASID